jgi:hypothetical protein
MELDFSDLVIDKSAVTTTPDKLVEEWLWLMPEGAEPLLPTACGDLFLRCTDGSVAFLDTYAGSCAVVAKDYQSWKGMLQDSEPFERWFRPALVADLLTAGLRREPGKCFSPYVPQIINGTWEPSNFQTCSLFVHLACLGQIHRQVKDLPPGTRIAGFEVVEE